MSCSDEVLEKNEKWKNNKGRIKKMNASERQAISSKGGQALKLAYNRKKLLKDLMFEALEMKDEETGLENAIALTLAQIERAKQKGADGNKGYEIVRDTIGQKPSENVTMQVDLPEFVNDLEE